MASQYFGKQNLTDEQRKQKSELARRMHQEVVVDPITGEERRKFGGPQPRSGRPRKITANERIAERVATEADAYFDRLDDIAKNHPQATAAITAIRELLGIEREEVKRAEQEQQRLDKLQRDDLIYLALDLIKKTGIVGGGFIVDGEIEEVEDGGYPELSA